MRDIYSTTKIVQQLERGVRPWIKPWSGGVPLLPIRHNGASYRGINVLALWLRAEQKGYAAARWMTQALELGGAVRKGEKGTLAVFAKRLTRIKINEATGEQSGHEINCRNGYTVFNVAKISGVPNA